MKSKILFLTLIILTACNHFKPEEEKKSINTFLDKWHTSAATADEKIFFDSFTDKNAIYIGTDPSEYWTAEQLEGWSKPYFEKESAWDFKPYNRHIYFSEDGKTAWFDELLDTWMGTCRGSGILIKKDGNWKLAHYHLSIAVPNNLTKEYIQLLEKPNTETPISNP